jgi:transposase
MHKDSILMDDDRAQVCRLEVVDTGRRRRWSLEEKLRIVEESYQGEGQASVTARRHGISSGLLFNWRRAFRNGDLGGGAAAPGLVPAVIEADEAVGRRVPLERGRMEITIGPGRRIIVGRDVDRAALAVVIDVLERR